MPQTNVKHWRRLDNAAKLFPAASSKRDTRVFRFYCELKEDIQQEILQKAVDRTNIRSFCPCCERDCSGIIWNRVIKDRL